MQGEEKPCRYEARVRKRSASPQDAGAILGIYAHNVESTAVSFECAAYDRSCEVTIYVDRDARRRGWGRILYEELERRLEALGILNPYACIAVPIGDDEYLTRDSERFHARMGYKRAGRFHRCGHKFDRWYDVVWMEKIIGAHDEEPQS